ncbi:cytochrome b6 [compost metagenome]
MTAVVIIIVQLISGMWLTKQYVPDIIDSYASVDYLQQEVSITASSGMGWLYAAAACLGVGILYGAVRIFFILKRSK